MRLVCRHNSSHLTLPCTIKRLQEIHFSSVVHFGRTIPPTLPIWPWGEPDTVPQNHPRCFPGPILPATEAPYHGLSMASSQGPGGKG